MRRKENKFRQQQKGVFMLVIEHMECYYSGDRNKAMHCTAVFVRSCSGGFIARVVL